MNFKKSVIILSVIAVITMVAVPIGMSYGEEKIIPDWFKTSLKFYLDGGITDSELIDSLEFLAKEGIINLEQKQYEPFSKEKFPDTGGFNPAWLEGEKEKLLKNCQDASDMGYDDVYCQYVQ